MKKDNGVNGQMILSEQLKRGNQDRILRESQIKAMEMRRPPDDSFEKSRSRSNSGSHYSPSYKMRKSNESQASSGPNRSQPRSNGKRLPLGPLAFRNSGQKTKTKGEMGRNSNQNCEEAFNRTRGTFKSNEELGLGMLEMSAIRQEEDSGLSNGKKTCNNLVIPQLIFSKDKEQRKPSPDSPLVPMEIKMKKEGEAGRAVLTQEAARYRGDKERKGRMAAMREEQRKQESNKENQPVSMNLSRESSVIKETQVQSEAEKKKRELTFRYKGVEIDFGRIFEEALKDADLFSKCNKSQKTPQLEGSQSQLKGSQCCTPSKDHRLPPNPSLNGGSSRSMEVLKRNNFFSCSAPKLEKQKDSTFSILEETREKRESEKGLSETQASYSKIKEKVAFNSKETQEMLDKIFGKTKGNQVQEAEGHFSLPIVKRSCSIDGIRSNEGVIRTNQGELNCEMKEGTTGLFERDNGNQLKKVSGFSMISQNRPLSLINEERERKPINECNQILSRIFQEPPSSAACSFLPSSTDSIHKPITQNHQEKPKFDSLKTKELPKISLQVNETPSLSSENLSMATPMPMFLQTPLTMNETPPVKKALQIPRDSLNGNNPNKSFLEQTGDLLESIFKNLEKEDGNPSSSLSGSTNSHSFLDKIYKQNRSIEDSNDCSMASERRKPREDFHSGIGSMIKKNRRKRKNQKESIEESWMDLKEKTFSWGAEKDSGDSSMSLNFMETNNETFRKKGAHNEEREKMNSNDPWESPLGNPEWGLAVFKKGSLMGESQRNSGTISEISCVDQSHRESVGTEPHNATQRGSIPSQRESSQRGREPSDREQKSQRSSIASQGETKGSQFHRESQRELFGIQRESPALQQQSAPLVRLNESGNSMCLSNCLKGLSEPCHDGSLGEWLSQLPKEKLVYKGCAGQSGFGAIFLKETGLIYEGDFENGSFHGRGLLMIKNMMSSTSFRQVNHQDFSGFLSCTDKYEGDFSKGLMSGLGTLHFASGEKYSGQIEGNVISGLGTFMRRNGGGKITGEWSRNKLIQTYP